MLNGEVLAAPLLRPVWRTGRSRTLVFLGTFLLVRVPDTLAQAFHQIAVHKLRTALAVMGIVVGVGACVASIAVMDGLQGLELVFWQRIGGDRLGFVWTPDAVYKAGRETPLPKVYRMNTDDIPFLLEAVPELELMAPSVRLLLDVRSRRAVLENMAISFAGTDLAAIRNFRLQSGRFFTEAEAREGARVAVPFSTVAEDLFGPEDPVGQEILAGKQRVRVIGVLRPLGEWGPRLIYMPFQTGQARFGASVEPWSAAVKVREGANHDLVSQDIREALIRRHPGSSADNFRVRWIGEFQERSMKDIRAKGRVLIFVAVLCLISGGVGILNVFLISVTERTREIGLRMALGASRRSVLAQFLFEAFFLCSLGGLSGLILGQSAAWAFGAIYRARGKYDPTYIDSLSLAVGTKGALLALGMAFLTAVVFGTLPAWRASRLDPVECMRHE